MVAFEAYLGDDPKSTYRALTLTLASIGSLTLLYYAISLFTLLYHLLVPGINIKQFRKGDRPAYAIITGPTSGIGKSFAFALAKNGFNLILVSRSQSKLVELQSEIKQKYPNIETKIVPVDVGKYPLDQSYADTVKEVARQDGDIRVLINNAGISHDMPVTFEDTDSVDMEAIMGVNTAGALRVTKVALPYMLNDLKKKRLIVNVGSFAGFAPTPLLATYSGSKAFLAAWSLATKSELSSKNVVVQHLNAYLVTTKLAKIRRPNIITPTENAFVKAALNNIGRDSSPYWSHMIYEWVLEHATFVVGGRLGSVVTGINKRMHENIRRRALKKAAKGK